MKVREREQPKQLVVFMHIWIIGDNRELTMQFIIEQPLCPVVGRIEGLSMPSPNHSVFCCRLPYSVAPVFVQIVSPPLGWSPLSSFLVIWFPSGDTRCPSVVFEAVDMPCPGSFHSSYSVHYIYDFCPLSDPDVGISIFISDVEHISFHFGLCGRKFVLCLFGQCPGLCTMQFVIALLSIYRFDHTRCMTILYQLAHSQ